MYDQACAGNIIEVIKAFASAMFSYVFFVNVWLAKNTSKGLPLHSTSFPNVLLTHSNIAPALSQPAEHGFKLLNFPWWLHQSTRDDAGPIVIGLRPPVSLACSRLECYDSPKINVGYILLWRKESEVSTIHQTKTKVIIIYCICSHFTITLLSNAFS